MFYAYLHSRPNTEDASGIFYVGKGSGKRGTDLFRSNLHHRNIVRKYGTQNILVSKIECSSEDIAFELEKGLIKCLRRMNVVLCNRTDGGDGVKGYVRSEEWRKQHSETMKGKPSPTKGRSMSEEQRRKISETLKRVAPWKGKMHTPEARAKMGVNKGFVWINNGVNRKRVSPEEANKLIEAGYVFGIKIKQPN